MFLFLRNTGILFLIEPRAFLSFRCSLDEIRDKIRVPNIC